MVIAFPDHAARFLVVCALTLSLGVSLPGCERGAEEATIPAPPDPSETSVERAGAEQASGLRAGSQLAFGVPLPEGVVAVLLDDQMKTFRIHEELDDVVAFLQGEAPEHVYRQEDGRHLLEVREPALRIHVYAEARAVRIAVLREREPEERPRREAAAALSEDDEAEREGPRRIVMQDPERSAHSIPSAAHAHRSPGVSRERVDVPGGIGSEPRFLEEPGGGFSEAFYVPPGYLPNLPRGRDGYLRIEPTPEQRARRTVDGRPPRYFVPTNPAAGF